MSDMTYTYTLGNNSNGMSISTGRIEQPKTPKELIATRTVETKAGWVGQVIVDQEIIQEFGPAGTQEAAAKEANAYVVRKIKDLFR